MHACVNTRGQLAQVERVPLYRWSIFKYTKIYLLINFEGTATQLYG
jgi:hypothetical protein